MSSKHLVIVAGALVAGYAALELAGGRAATSVLTGAAPDSGGLLLGVFYMLSWFAAVMIAPPLVFAAALLWGVRTLGRAGTVGARCDTSPLPSSSSAAEPRRPS